MTSVELLRLLHGLKAHVRAPSHSITMPGAASGWADVLRLRAGKHDRHTPPYAAVEAWIDERIRDVSQALTSVPVETLPEALRRELDELGVSAHGARKSQGADHSFSVITDSSSRAARTTGLGNAYDDDDDDDDAELTILATTGAHNSGPAGDDDAFDRLDEANNGFEAYEQHLDIEGERGLSEFADDLDSGGRDHSSVAGAGSVFIDPALLSGTFSRFGSFGKVRSPFGLLDASLRLGAKRSGAGAHGAGMRERELRDDTDEATGRSMRAVGPGATGNARSEGRRDRPDLVVDRPDGSPADDSEGVVYEVKADISAEERRAMRDATAKTSMIDDFMRKLKSSAGDATATMRPDVEWSRLGLRPGAKLDKTSYGLLTRLPAFLRVRSQLLADLRTRMMRLPASGRRRVFEFCLLVDNSGSMDGAAGRQVRITLTLLMEVFRRLEVDFSVIRFGKSQRRLKQIDDPLSSLRGEFVVEALTFDEGTHLRSGVQAAVQHGFYRSRPLPAGVVVSRSIIIMSDGFVETGGEERVKYEALLMEAQESLRGKVRMCFLGLMERFAEKNRDQIMEGMNFLTGGITGKARENRSIAIIEPGKERDMVPSVCTLVGAQIGLMVKDAAEAERSEPPAPKVSSSGAAAASAAMGARRDADPLAGSSYVARLQTARRDPIDDAPATTASGPARRQVRPREAAAAASASSGHRAPASGLDFDDLAGLDEDPGAAAGVVAPSAAPPGMRAPLPVVIRDDPDSGIAAPRAFDFARTDAPIPKLDELTKAGVSLPPVEYAQDALLRWRQEVTEEFTRLGRLGSTPEDSREERQIRAASAEWSAFEARDTGTGGPRLVPQLADALAESLFTVNRYTRRKPDVRGSSLSMRGLIRFLLTNGSYKKIYQRPLAGPKREYKICVAFDRSASMMGGAARMSAYAVFAFLAAVKSVGLDASTTILAFGDTVELIKPDGIPLDARAVYRLLLACQPKMSFSEAGSFDADAIAVATGLMRASAARGPSKLFLFTDGYSSRPSRLPFTLQAASDSGIDVIALGVGTGTAGSGLPAAFQHWVAVDQPTMMPRALTAWASGRSGGASGSGSGSGVAEDRGGAAMEAALMVEAAAAVRAGNADMTMDDAFERRSGVFTNLAEELDGDTSMFVKTSEGSAECGGGSLGIDILFAMDTTGSMGRWIASGKEHITRITAEVKSFVAKKSKATRLRTAFISYKDYDSAGRTTPNQIDHIDFTEDTAAVCAKVNAQSASGGGDGPEDICGCFRQAFRLDWQAKARFLILILDAPCHGSEFHSWGDSHPRGDPGGDDPREQLKRLKADGVRVMVTDLSSNLSTMMTKFEGAYNDADTSAPGAFKLTRLKIGSDPTKDVDEFVKAVSEDIKTTLMADFF